MFIWDTNRVGLLGKPRNYAGPLRWFGRGSPAYNFEITLSGKPGKDDMDTSDYCGSENVHLYKLIFHPSAPFVISLQRLYTTFYVNFHFRLNTN